MNEFDVVDQFGTPKKEYDRTVFLTILCIATFIGSWVTILYYTLYINKVDDIERSVYHFDEGRLEYMLMKVSIGASFLSFIGSIFIWRMRRIGLFIYALGQIIPAALIFYIFIVMVPVEYPKSVIMIGYGAMQLLFICLYILNWKILRW